jgi:TonB family protein
MSTPARRLIAPFLLAASFAHSAFGQAPGRDVVGAARDLYASARYDEALAVLDDIRPSAGSGAGDLKAIEQYRSLCLLALGRGTEAESAIAAVVTADPSYQPGEAEASPRVRSAFSEVRRRLLPEIATTRYGRAKEQFDRKNYDAAAQQFREVLALLDDPDTGGRLPDLRTLTAGFLDLAIAAAAPPPAPSRPMASTPPARAPAVKPVAAQPPHDSNRTYTMQDKNVTAPVIVRQEMPRLTPAMTAQAKSTGVVEIVIDELGRVIHATIRQSVHPNYDVELLSAAREWRYEPARLGSAPVRYRKLIQINVSR